VVGKLIVAAVAGGLGIACAEDSALDVAGLEESIAEALLPAVVEGVECPEALAADTFEVGCRGSIEGVTIDISALIEIGDGSLDRAVAAVSIDARLLNVDEVALEAGDRLSDDLGSAAEVSCPAPVVVIEQGTSLDCTVVDLDSGTSRPLTITLLDADGAWEMDLFP